MRVNFTSSTRRCQALASTRRIASIHLLHHGLSLPCSSINKPRKGYNSRWCFFVHAALLTFQIIVSLHSRTINAPKRNFGGQQTLPLKPSRPTCRSTAWKKWKMQPCTLVCKSCPEQPISRLFRNHKPNVMESSWKPCSFTFEDSFLNSWRFFGRFFPG
ncbi:hypothetical protein T4A_6189 [Trichinella pseudospiralis]|uniref:Uncharacterized protein n=1 Tax=Trichinella pseudospiralis TaxID=6337 RepID=A0A0V1EYG7_TRIPS|nr:hypothetical protein T4A_6189 [Trichinella pseudospiralis]